MVKGQIPPQMSGIMRVTLSVGARQTGSPPEVLLPILDWAVTMRRRIDSLLFRERTNPVAVSVAVVGATGAVGAIMRQVLVEHNFPLLGIKFLASERSAGKTIEFKGK